ncbi:MAG: AI-2E family transporter [Steroidobacteraceae bacterium]
MAEESNSRALRHWFTVGAVLVLLLAVWLILRPLALPIAWAAIVGFLMHPLQVRLTRRLKGRSTLAASLITGLTPVALFVPLTLLAIAFLQQVGTLTTHLQQNTDMFSLASWLDSTQHPRIAGLITWISTRFNVQVSDMQAYLRDSVQTWAGTLAKSGGLAFLFTAGVLLRFFLMLFILFFSLRDGEMWFKRVAALLPLTKTHSSKLFTRMGKVLRAVVYGCGLTALVQGTLVTIGFAIAGLSGPIVFGVVASVLALLPFGGAALVWVPGMLYLFATGSIGWGIFMLAWGGVVSISDNFIRPAIISRYTPVPTLLVFLGVIGGVAAFGPIGFIIGPVILVLAIELLREAEGSITRSD